MKALPSAFQGIPELQEINVQKVDFFGSAQHHLWDGNFSLSSNGKLIVTGINEPNEIWHNQLEVGCLHKVKFMRVQCCGKLLTVVSSNLMQRLHNMKGLKVWWCGSLEMIFDLQEGVCASASSSCGAGEEETSITPLDFLELKYLPKLMHVWKNVSQEIRCFESLTFLTVEWCDNLRYIFTISMAKLLVNLEDLYIRHSEKVERIVTRENEEEILLRQFHRVKLTNLPSLVCFGLDINDIEILVRRSNINFCLKFAANDGEDHYYDYNEDDFDDEDYEEDFGPSDDDFPCDYFYYDDDSDDGDDFGNDDDENDDDDDDNGNEFGNNDDDDDD